MPRRVDKNHPRQSAGPARHPVMAFFEDSIITPVKKHVQQGVHAVETQVQQEVHNIGERFYDAERYKANLKKQSAAELQDIKRRIEGDIARNYCRTSSTIAATATRFHILPHSPNTYTTFPRAVGTTVRSACNVTKDASQLLHVREELTNKGEPMSWCAWKDIPRAAWQGTTGGTTFAKAALREAADQYYPIPTGAFYADDPSQSNVLQAQQEFVEAGDGLIDAYKDIRKLLSDPPTRRPTRPGG